MNLAEIVRGKKLALTTEFMPPKKPDLQDLKRKVESVSALVDAVNIPELKANGQNRLKYRMSSFYTALRIRESTSIETVFHITPRDFNRNALAGLLLAALESQMQNVVVVGGDRYTAEEEKALSRNVYDVRNTAKMVRIIRQLEADLAEQSYDARFCISVGTDPTVVYANSRKNVQAEIEKLLERQEAGADLAHTQPVFDDRFFEFYDLAREAGLRIPVLVGLIPLKGFEDSLQVEQRFRIVIPQNTKARLRGGNAEEGLRIAQEIFGQLASHGANGIHIYPRERPEVISIIVGEVRTGRSRV